MAYISASSSLFYDETFFQIFLKPLSDLQRPTSKRFSYRPIFLTKLSIALHSPTAIRFTILFGGREGGGRQFIGLESDDGKRLKTYPIAFIA